MSIEEFEAWRDVLWICLVWAFCVPIGYAIGRERGRGKDGAALWLLGPLGWIVAGLLPDARPRCPACGAVLSAGTIRCPRCRAALPAPAA